MTKQEWIKIGWKLLECKYLYYRSVNKESPLSDSEYDKLEIQYLEGCRKFKKPNTIVHKKYSGFEDVEGDGMMEFDITRPSCRLVVVKCGGTGYE